MTRILERSELGCLALCLPPFCNRTSPSFPMYAQGSKKLGTLSPTVSPSLCPSLSPTMSPTVFALSPTVSPTLSSTLSPTCLPPCLLLSVLPLCFHSQTCLALCLPFCLPFLFSTLSPRCFPLVSHFVSKMWYPSCLPDILSQSRNIFSIKRTVSWNSRQGLRRNPCAPVVSQLFPRCGLRIVFHNSELSPELVFQ